MKALDINNIHCWRWYWFITYDTNKRIVAMMRGWSCKGKDESLVLFCIDGIERDLPYGNIKRWGIYNRQGSPRALRLLRKAYRSRKKAYKRLTTKNNWHDYRWKLDNRKDYKDPTCPILY